MKSIEVVEALAALAQESRLALFRLLVKRGPEGYAAGDIGERLGIPAPTLSFHLKTLTSSGLISARKDGRFLYYSANFDQMNQIVSFLTEHCCSLATDCTSQACAAQTCTPVTRERTYHVLFLCTGNSARSILAEALLNKLGHGRFIAYSAGSHPNGKVNPYAIELLQRLGFETTQLRSKAWDEFAVPSAPQLDFVFTVCDNAAGEVCPVWPGQPMTAHWGLPDPAAVHGTDVDKANAFRETFRALERRINLFTALPISSLDQLSLNNEIRAIGKGTGDVDV